MANVNPGNALVGNRRTNAAGQEVDTLFTGQAPVNAEIGEYCVNAKQRALWARPAGDIDAFRGRVEPNKVRVRPSYLNAVLIQSRGSAGMTCEACAVRPDRGPFTDCRRVRGHFDGACGNCKWRDHAARCTVRAPGEPEDPVGGQPIAGVVQVEEVDDDDDDNAGQEGGGGQAVVLAAAGGGGNPIILISSDEESSGGDEEGGEGDDSGDGDFDPAEW